MTTYLRSGVAGIRRRDRDRIAVANLSTERDSVACSCRRSHMGTRTAAQTAMSTARMTPLIGA
jgi:hypothetical protein